MTRSATTDDDAPREFEAIAVTETVAQMFDFESFCLIDEILVATGGSFPRRFPVLQDHSRRVTDLIGTASGAHMVGSNWNIRFVLNGGQPAREAAGKIVGGDLKNTSVGYRLLDWHMIPAGGEKKIGSRLFKATSDRALRVVTAFEVMEISLVVFGADPNALIKRAASTYRRPGIRQDDPQPRKFFR